MTRNEKIAEMKSKQIYHIDLIKEDGTGYFAKVREFPGCMTQGETIGETLLNIADAMTAWLSSVINHGDNLPGGTR